MSKKVINTTPPQLQGFTAAAEPLKTRSASVRPINNNGPVPVQPVATNVQLTPIVQPIAFVPYSTQKQPLLTFDEGYEEDLYQSQAEGIAQNAEPQQYDFQEAAAPVAKKKKRVSGAAIVLILLSLLSVAVLVLGKFITDISKYLAVAVINGAELSGFGAVELLISNIKANILLDVANIIPAAVAIVALFAALTFITCLFAIMHRGACVFAKITTFFAFAFSLVNMIYQMINSISLVGYGAYILVGLSFIAVLVAYLSKNDKKIKKSKNNI